MTRQISLLDRLLLLLTGLLAAFQVAVGIDGLGRLPVASYTVGFGVLLVAGLLLIILGFEVLESPLVVIVSTIIPLSLSVGLVAQFYPTYITGYLAFAVLGFLLVAITRFLTPGGVATVALIIVHSIAGLLIFALPLYLSLSRSSPPAFAWVGIGGALIGLGGILLSFLKAGRPILPRNTILGVLPALLLLTTAAFVLGFTALG